MEVDEVLANNDVGDTITIISHLEDTRGQKKREFNLMNSLNVFKLYFQTLGISDTHISVHKYFLFPDRP